MDGSSGRCLKMSDEGEGAWPGTWMYESSNLRDALE